MLVLALATVAGLIAAYAMDRVPCPEAVRRRVAVALLVAVALVPVAGVAALRDDRSRGLTGEVSHVVLHADEHERRRQQHSGRLAQSLGTPEPATGARA